MTEAIEQQVPAAKWWGNSLTIQGALISAASAALPVLGAVVGIDLSSDTVRLLGAQTIAVAQAVGGLAGMLMTVTGRLRAATRLERRSVMVKV